MRWIVKAFEGCKEARGRGAHAHHRVMFPERQAYGTVSGSLRPGDSAAGADGGWQHAATEGGSDSPGSASGGGGGRTELSPDEAGAIVAVLEYLVANFQHLAGGDGSPLYNAAATHTLE